VSKNAADMRELYGYIGNYLARRHPEDPSIYGPELAVNLTEADDGLTYTVHLRKGVLWHEPTVDWDSGKYEWLRGPHEMVSDDFVFAIEAIQNPDVGGRAAALRNYFEGLDRIEVDRRPHLRAPLQGEALLEHRDLLRARAVPRLALHVRRGREAVREEGVGNELNEHWYNQSAIGTGPYRFVSWEPGVRVVMERNPDYFGEKPAFERIEYNIVKDQNAWPRMLKTGQLDITRLQPEQYKTEVPQGGTSVRRRLTSATPTSSSRRTRRRRTSTSGGTRIVRGSRTRSCAAR
jgi:peptide/nickel transport system substrate-binding protein